MIQHSDSIGKVVAALATVQAAVGFVTKNAANPYFNNTYTDLNTFLHALAEPMRAAGLTLIQGPGMRDGWVTVETMIVHASGEWLRSEAAAPMPKADPQGAGSAITYLRRYSLAALFAIPQEDDDGNAAGGVGRDADGVPREEAKATPRQAKQKAANPLTIPTACPRCAGAIWDNRKKKATGEFSAKAPDFSCRDKSCGWAQWSEPATSDFENVNARVAVQFEADDEDLGFA